MTASPIFYNKNFISFLIKLFPEWNYGGESYLCPDFPLPRNDNENFLNKTIKCNKY
jgi:hypothetical protein